MSSWGFLRHNCRTQEAQPLAILTEGSCRARVCFCKPRPSSSNRRLSPAAAAPAAARAGSPPRACRGRRGPDATVRFPHPTPRRARDGGGSFPTPSPSRSPAFSREAAAFYCSTTGKTGAAASQSATLQVRPAPCWSSGSFPLTQESLPKRENRHEERRGCRPTLLRQPPRVPAARRQPRTQLLQPQLMPPSPAAPT